MFLIFKMILSKKFALKNPVGLKKILLDFILHNSLKIFIILDYPVFLGLLSCLYSNDCASALVQC